MFNRLRNAVKPSKSKSLAGSFSWLGWTGFWLQVVFGSFSIIMMIYYFAFSRAEPRSGFQFIEYLTLANLVLLGFTTLWSYRYTRLAKRIQDPEKRPTESYITNTVWTGVVASAIGMLFSMIVMIIEAANLLFYFLKAPQGGMPVIQTQGSQAVYWVSSVDMVSLMSLVLILFAELLVLIFSLWLLFRSNTGSPEFPQPTAE